MISRRKKNQPSPLFSVKKPFKQTPQLSSHPRRLGNDLLMGISKTNRWFCSQATWSLLTTLPLVVSFSSFSLFLFLFQSFPTGSGVIILSSRTFDNRDSVDLSIKCPQHAWIQRININSGVNQILLYWRFSYVIKVYCGNTNSLAISNCPLYIAFSRGFILSMS